MLLPLLLRAAFAVMRYKSHIMLSGYLIIFPTK
jgi:hypothetical protein